MENAQAQKMNKGVSVIVCTFNGSSRLPTTIQHIAAQNTGDIDWEVIFVDNGSTDDSMRIVDTEWRKCAPVNAELRILQVNKHGKIFALEQAFSQARFEYAIICDDDNWLSPEYIKLVYEILDRDSNIGAVGGQSVAATDSGTFPDWFRLYQDGYAVGFQGSTTGDITSRGYVWGAGMGTRTALYNSTYQNFPSLLTGRDGYNLTAGEDSEYCQRLIMQGYLIHYDSRLFFTHYMPQSRLDIGYRDKLFKGFEASNTVLRYYYDVNKFIKIYKGSYIRRVRYIFASIIRVAFSKNERKSSEAKTALIFAGIIPAKSNSVLSKIICFYKKARINS